MVIVNRSLINRSEIVWDKDIYPREKWNTNTIRQYADAMMAGASFPPIVLHAKTRALLDGKHRTEALEYWHKLHQEQQHQIAEGKEVKENDLIPAPPDEIEVELVQPPEEVPLKLFCASLSSIHGDRLTLAEKKALAREVVAGDNNYDLKNLASALGVSKRSVYNYVQDIIAKQREQENAVIMRLMRLGWTQEEIGEAIGKKQNTIAEKVSDFENLQNPIKSQITSGHTPQTVAERNGLPHQLAWALKLDGREDKDRMEALGIKIQPYDVWNFSSCHDLMGDKHPGRIPGEIVAHVLYFYTNHGDTIIDPMAGSGTTLDACLLMGRKAYGYDVDHRHERKDILQHNILKEGWPERTKKANLIFWDPPYFDKMDSNRIGEDGYVAESISKLDKGAYLDFFDRSFAQAYNMVKPGTRLAFLMSDFNDEEDESRNIFIHEYLDLLFEAKWKMERHIQCPLPTQQVHPDIVLKFRKAKRLTRLGRYLLILKK